MEGRAAAVEPLGHELGEVVEQQLGQLARRRERPPRDPVPRADLLQEAVELRVALRRGLLHVHEPGHIADAEVLVLDG